MSKFRNHLSKTINVDKRYFGYIQDGLILGLDGINKGNTYGVWTDYVSGVNFTGKGIQMHNGFQFDGSTNYGLKSSVTYNLVPSQITIEACFSSIESYWGFIVNIGRGDSMQLSYHLNASLILPYHHMIYHNGIDTYCWNPNFSLLQKTTISFSNSGGCGQCGNFVFSKTQYTDGGITGDRDRYIRLCYRDASSSAKSVIKLHAVRIYNRTLTKDEMIHNQQVDNSRFILGI